MDVFISWSGQRSQAVAQALRNWLPMVIQSLQPWMSASDIESGAPWFPELAAHLKECKVGVICLTPENLTAPYLMFEAGALSKTVEATYVIPYLFQMDISAVQGPLAQFQARKAIQLDTKKMMDTINRACGDIALSAAQLDKAFDVWWPQLEKSLQGVPDAEKQQGPQRTQPEILEEILSLVRTQSQQIAALAQKPPDPIAATGTRVPVLVPTRSQRSLVGVDWVEFMRQLKAIAASPTTPAPECDSDETARGQPGDYDRAIDG